MCCFLTLLALASCIWGDILMRAMRRADLSMAKACIYLGGDGKPLNQSLVLRRLRAEDHHHFPLDHLDKLPLSVHREIGPIAIAEFGLPPEMAAVLQHADAERYMLKMSLRKEEESEQESA